MAAAVLLLAVLVGINGCLGDNVDAAGLTGLKEGFGNPKVLRGWVGEDPCGDGWFGIECIMVETEEQRVTTVQLSNMELQGKISSDLYFLDYLAIMDLSLNPGIVGDVPAGDSLPFRLTHLNLQGCSLSGVVPQTFNQLPSLQYLSLGRNQLVRSVPPSLGEVLTLRWLDLGENRLSGPVPDLGRLMELQHLNLRGNLLSGSIPRLGSLPLEALILDGNQFTGDLPSKFATIGTLQVLSVGNNPLKAGPFPAAIAGGNLSSLVHLSMSRSGFTGGIPSLKLFLSLQKVDFSRNFLSGHIPPASAFKGLPHLRAVDLHSNKLTGTMPDLTALTNISLINAENNAISDVSAAMLAAGFQQSPHLHLSGNPVCAVAALSHVEQVCGGLASAVLDYVPPAANVCATHGCPKGLQPRPMQLPNEECMCSSFLSIQLQMDHFSRGAFVESTAAEVAAAVSASLSMQVTGLHLEPSQVVVAWARMNASTGSWLMEVQIFQADNTFDKVFLMKIITAFNMQTILLGPGLDPYRPVNFTLPAFSATASSSPSPQQGGGPGWWAILSALLLSMAAVGLCVCAAWALHHRRRARRLKLAAQGRDDGGLALQLPIHGVTKFALSEILAASDNFNIMHKLGEGGYGTVYKVIMRNGQTLAVKRALKSGESTFSAAGRMQAFLREIELLSCVRHRNLVELVGYCVEGGEQLLLYPFMQNGNLQQHLQGHFIPPLSWMERLFIALGTTRGLEYLHEHVDPPIIHRDMKASNILLDDRLVAKVADFGLSKFGSTRRFQLREVSMVKGTLGYLDPEYAQTGTATLKSDVYGFGVLLLEIITAKEPFAQHQEASSSFLETIKNKLLLEGVGAIVDPNLEDYPPEGLAQLLNVVFQCVNTQGDNRPPMKQVVKEIEAICQQYAHPDHDNEDVMIRPVARTNQRDYHFNPELFSSLEMSYGSEETVPPRHLAADILKSMSTGGRLQGGGRTDFKHALLSPTSSESGLSTVEVSEGLLHPAHPVGGREASLFPQRFFPLSKTVG